MCEIDIKAKTKNPLLLLLLFIIGGGGVGVVGAVAVAGLIGFVV
jgi:hypothetical protein